MDQSAISTILLRRLRVLGDERQLTDCLGEAAKYDDGIARGIAISLLTSVRERNGGIEGQRADRLLETMPSELGCVPENAATGKPEPRPRLRRQRPALEGRIDWVLMDKKERWRLAVEVKIEAGLGENQLRTYHDDLEGRCGEKGLMVLAKSPPTSGLLTTQDQHWLGVALWEDAFSHLCSLKPSDPSLGAQWPLLMEVLNEDGDLGVPRVEWAGLDESLDNARKTLLARLASRLQPHARQHLRNLLVKRPPARGKSPAARDRLVKASISRRGKQPAITLDLPKDTAVRIKLGYEAQALVVSVGVQPPKRPKLGGPKAKHDRAVEKLKHHGFIVSQPWLEAERRANPSQGLPEAAALELINEALAQAISSGILDMAVDGLK